MTTNLPALEMAYDRRLLNEVKLGRGKGMKKLRDELKARPEIQREFLKDREVELSNQKQKEKMMWVKDANSRVHRVENDFRDKCTFTNPMNTPGQEIPRRKLVEKTKYMTANRIPSKSELDNKNSIFGGGGAWDK